MLVYTYFIFEVLAFLAALWRWPKMQGTPYKYFVPYLLYVVIYEYGSLQDWFVINHSNLYIANINISIAFFFNSLFLTSLLKTPRFKKAAKIAIILSIPFAAINMAFFQGFWRLDTATILL
ncbi:hypothetical protein BC343_20655 [Mucilaginibacter pedocola]|uniref:Histidine kinase N-terminal 7TM region domain-containing protein n=1 Tax=Mucilaginibacter pedocola TaxID=1792845 RepID=A0A1S9PK95_9SPHI|nr:hypothetical protein BC343_20655 [Mucilaginibacter pedocola]